MSDRPWDEKDGWEKAWEVTEVVGGLARTAQTTNGRLRDSLSAKQQCLLRGQAGTAAAEAVAPARIRGEQSGGIRRSVGGGCRGRRGQRVERVQQNGSGCMQYQIVSVNDDRIGIPSLSGLVLEVQHRLA